ncbi:MAG: hypothetical protein JO083_09555 [Candidatus Eremiobacteraeota bacterium]|nr:hypothetical protein [Candidatus Eremiobacteraeota bacterium]
MMAAIALSSLIGTWACATQDTKMKARYTFRANQTGTLVWTGTRPLTVRRFTFRLYYDELEEDFTGPKAGVPELHTVKLRGNHLIDEVHVYLHEGIWTPYPMEVVLDCRR